jgi:flagellar hook-associated protein 2
MNEDRTALTSQVSALDGLESAFSALQSALGGIEEAVSGGGVDATVSNTEVAEAILGDNAQEGYYSVDVLDAGSYASSLTSASWVVSAEPRTYQLTVGEDTYDITPSDTSVSSVAAAINSKAGDKVRATVVNVGSADSPDYRISLRALSLGDMTLGLQYASSSLQTQSDPPGRLASYVVNNSGLTVTSDSRTVEIASGLTIKLLSADAGKPVDITVTRSTSSLTSALESFTSAYNAATEALDGQRGQSGGALSGQALLYDLSQKLWDISTYSSGESGAGGLSDLGIELGSDGKLTFNSLKLMAQDMVNSAAVTAFFGNSSTGGFLKTASDALATIMDGSNGTLTTAQDGVASSIDNLDDRIAEKQKQVDNLEERLLKEMAEADATIATMEQQYTYISSLFDAMSSADKDQ